MLIGARTAAWGGGGGPAIPTSADYLLDDTVCLMDGIDNTSWNTHTSGTNIPWYNLVGANAYCRASSGGQKPYAIENGYMCGGASYIPSGNASRFQPTAVFAGREGYEAFMACEEWTIETVGKSDIGNVKMLYTYDTDGTQNNSLEIQCQNTNFIGLKIQSSTKWTSTNIDFKNGVGITLTKKDGKIDLYCNGSRFNGYDVPTTAFTSNCFYIGDQTNRMYHYATRLNTSALSATKIAERWEMDKLRFGLT